MSIKNLKPTPNSKYESGYYSPKYPDKYRGDLKKIIYRSSYERRMCQFCDFTDSVIEWSSEPIAIMYTSMYDNRRHKYWVDFWVKLNNGKEFIVEVKPSMKLKKPRKTKRNIKSFNEAAKEYLVNYSKFQAASQFAKASGMEFIIADENFLFSIKSK